MELQLLSPLTIQAAPASLFILIPWAFSFLVLGDLIGWQLGALLLGGNIII